MFATNSDPIIEGANRRLEALLERGEFPNVRRQLQVSTQVANTGMEWTELIDKMTAHAAFVPEGYYERMLDGIWNIEWCLGASIPRRLCYYPATSPLPPGGPAPKSRARAKAVYSQPLYGQAPRYKQAPSLLNP